MKVDSKTVVFVLTLIGTIALGAAGVVSDFYPAQSKATDTTDAQSEETVHPFFYF